MSRILLAGEQVTSIGFEVKGFDYFGVSAYKEDGQVLVEALTGGGHEVQWCRTCQVATDFPEREEEIRRYDVVILSDVGSNSLLFHPEMVGKSVRHPDRLRLLRDYVTQGGGLVMVGGWMSFAGIDGRARYHGTAVEEALPVTCLAVDDRRELPEGAVPVVPDPQPISWGRSCQGMAVLSTNRMPVSVCRSFKGFRPGCRRRRRFGGGKSGWMMSQRASSTSGLAMSIPPTGE